MLGNCLNISDLKCCRLVNQKFNQMVMDETKFKDSVVLNVEKGKLTPEDFGETKENWKNIGLNAHVEHALNLTNLRMVVSAIEGSGIFELASTWKRGIID